MTWSRVSLEEISDSIDYGYTASAKFHGKGPKFLRITDIQEGKVEWSTVPHCDWSERDQAASRLEEGDIVFARTGATTGKSFLLRSVPRDAIFASYLIRVRPRKAMVEPAYLARFFESADYWAQIYQRSSGTAQGGVNASKLKSLSIPLPPLPEQRRIAAILDKADALRAKRREAIAKLDQLLQSVFLDMFGDPTSAPAGGRDVRFVELGELMVRGRRTLDPANFREEEFELHSIPAFDAGAPEVVKGEHIGSAKQLVQGGDVMISKIVPHIRRSVVVPTARGRRQIASGEWIVFRDDRIEPAYLQRLFITDTFHAKFMATVAGVGGSLLRARPAHVAKIRVAVPPLPAQRKFTAFAARIEETQRQMRAGSNELAGFFAALQHHAFSDTL